MTVTVRGATAEDSDTIAELARGLREALGDPLDFMTADRVRRDGFGDRPEFSVLLAEESGRGVGYSLFFDCYEPAYAARGLYIADLYVRPESRRRGIARQLIAATAGVARDRGRGFVWWVTQAANEPAQAMYRSVATVEVMLHGFAVTGDRFAAMADAKTAG